MGLKPIPQGEYPWADMLAQDRCWMDRYGRLIKITRMSDRYLENALRYALRASWGQAALVADLAAGAHGDMAQMSLDMIMDDYMEGRVELIEAIIEEQERRKLRPKWVEAVLDRFRR